MLIAVPTILVGLLVLVFFLGDGGPIPWPWHYVHALKASVLYSTIDTKSFKAELEDAEWKRSTSPYSQKDKQAHVRPEYDRKSRSYSWSAHQLE